LKRRFGIFFYRGEAANNPGWEDSPLSSSQVNSGMLLSKFQTRRRGLPLEIAGVFFKLMTTVGTCFRRGQLHLGKVLLKGSAWGIYL